MSARFTLTAVLCTCAVLTTPGSYAQIQAPPVTRFAVLQAENRRALTLRDLSVIRSGTRSADPQTARIAVRALGRLERPSLIPDIRPVLKHAWPEVRAEAANALGQALQGTRAEAPANATVVDSVIAALTNRLTVETDT